MLECLKKDIKRYTGLNKIRLIDIIKCYFHYKGIQAVVLFRLSNWFYKKGYKIIAVLIKNYNIRITGCEISESAEIGEGLVIPHPNGIVIGQGVIIGNNAKIHQQVTIGVKQNHSTEFPEIGTDVFIGAGAKILGKIKIGNNVRIGANAVVLIDVPDNCIVVGIPGEIIKTKN